MPHYDVRLRIVCGETTCAVVAGRFCEYLTTVHGSDPRCAIFGELSEVNGWVQRDAGCIASATPAEKPKGSA